MCENCMTAEMSFCVEIEMKDGTLLRFPNYSEEERAVATRIVDHMKDPRRWASPNVRTARLMRHGAPARPAMLYPDKMPDRGELDWW